DPYCLAPGGWVSDHGQRVLVAALLPRSNTLDQRRRFPSIVAVTAAVVLALSIPLPGRATSTSRAPNQVLGPAPLPILPMMQRSVEAIDDQRPDDTEAFADELAESVDLLLDRAKKLRLE